MYDLWILHKLFINVETVSLLMSFSKFEKLRLDWLIQRLSKYDLLLATVRSVHSCHCVKCIMWICGLLSHVQLSLTFPVGRLTWFPGVAVLPDFMGMYMYYKGVNIYVILLLWIGNYSIDCCSGFIVPCLCWHM